MEMEQLMECLLAKTDARMDANTKTMQEIMDTTQERMYTSTKPMKEMMNEIKDRIKEDMNANRKTDREENNKK
jgi:ElaB/YqjD/DUF883 family membrane-anchored ribosome-binding protein